jgi:dTDP-4-dehydrorhamnose 3,5-epimerase
MMFCETKIKGVLMVEMERQVDGRGFFARTWCRREFAERGLASELVQCSVSFNVRRGTLRGLHYQIAPSQEVKLVRCTAGAIHDVVVDLRSDSPTFKKWFAVELSAANRRMLYVPKDVAHGFLTLDDNTEVFYQMSHFYAPECARGVRWNDPAFNIEWPYPPQIIGSRDASYGDFRA